MLNTKKSKQLALIGVVFIFAILIINPLKMTTIIVDNLSGGGSDEVDIQAAWTITDAQGNEVHDGDTVSGVLDIEVEITGFDVGLVTNVDTVVDRNTTDELVIDMAKTGSSGGPGSGEVPAATYYCAFDTTQVTDGAHEVDLVIYLPDSGDGDGGDGGNNIPYSMFSFSSSGGSGGVTGGGSGGGSEDHDWSVLFSGLVFLALVGVALVLIVKKVR